MDMISNNKFFSFLKTNKNKELKNTKNVSIYDIKSEKTAIFVNGCVAIFLPTEYSGCIDERILSKWERTMILPAVTQYI